MTHQLLTPTGRSLLLIQVPEEAHDCWLHFNVVCCRGKVGFAEVYNHGWLYTEQQARESLEVKGKIIGLLSEVKEFDEYVEEVRAIGSNVGIQCFEDYQDDDKYFDTSKDSFLSLLAREGFVLEDTPLNKEVGGTEVGWTDYESELVKHINPSRTLLIEVKS